MNYTFRLIRITFFILMSVHLADAKGGEEVVIHTDKPFYLSGEMIWLKTYLKSGENNNNSQSVVVYVELLNNNERVLTRLKLKCVQGTASGNIKLPPGLPTGNYFLRAYTLYMQSLKQPTNSNKLTIFNLSNVRKHEFSTDETPEKASSRTAQELVNQYNLRVTPTKKSYKPREKVTLNISLSDTKGRLLQGNFSVSVTKNFNVKQEYYIKQFTDSTNQSDVPFRELFIYPQSKYTLNIIDFNSADTVDYAKKTAINPGLKNSLDEIIKRSEFITELAGVFSLSQPNYDDSWINIPIDKTYYPNEYADLPELKDFIREIIPEVQVKKKKEKDLIRLINTENKQHVFVYKKEPLLLVDGFVQTKTADFLSIPPGQISRIDISWREQTLNLTSIPRLVDNGIISIYTKDNQGETMDGRSFNINEGFSKVSQFSSPKYLPGELSSDRIPDFRNPLFWDPNVVVDGRAKLVFFLSDEFGEFLIEIMGFTEKGDIIQHQEKLVVEK